MFPPGLQVLGGGAGGMERAGGREGEGECKNGEGEEEGEKGRY